MSLFIRSLFFNVALQFITWGLMIAGLPIVLFCSRNVARRLQMLWVNCVLFALCKIVGATIEIRGERNLTAPPFLMASKHQSSLDIILILKAFPDAVFLVKKELFMIPIFNLYLKKLGHIYFDRKIRSQAFRKAILKCKSVAEQGEVLVVFPEGTRVKVGVARALRRGIVPIYKSLNIPVVPVCLNSGHIWGKGDFYKRSGHVVIQFLEKIPNDLEGKEFFHVLSDVIDSGTAALDRCTSCVN